MPLAPGLNIEPIPGYRLIERLGRGGFGEVWKAEAPGGLLKAIKFVYGDLESHSDDSKPAEQEWKALSRVKSIRHPYILSLERFDVVQGQLVIVMELADRNLWDRFRECRNQGLPGIPRDELLRYMEEAAEALDLMNSQYQMQHLDIKPQNLFLVYNHVKVADFGLVKDFEGMRGTVTGGVTPVYAAPETFDGWVSRFSDQYSLSIVYQELLTGQRPFNGSSTRQLLLQHLQAPPDLSALPECDRPIIGRALAKKPDERWSNCAEMIQALKRGSPTVAMPPAPVVEPPPSPSPPPSSIPSSPRPGAPLIRPSDRNDPTQTQNLPAAPITLQRPDFLRSVLMSQLPIAPAEQTGDGILFPALVVGLGHYGGLVIQQLRAAIREKIGPAQNLPQIRLLAIDTDPEAIQALTTDRSRPLPSNEVLLARLNRPSHYLKRDTSALESWLNTQLLYRIPRQPVTEGLRCFGRLAYWDHFRQIQTRLRAELELALDPSALTNADSATKLGKRTNRPRVYVVAGLAGGTGSGMYLDVAYLIRHQLRLFGYDRPDVVGVLFVPPVERGPGRPTLPVANTYASLVELHHFSQPHTSYEFKFDPREPPITDADRPFTRTLFLPAARSGDLNQTRAAAGLASGLMFRELLTPLGRAADEERDDYEIRHPREGLFCQTAMSYRFDWPRTRLLQRLALRLSQQMLGFWTAKDAGHLREPVQLWLDEQWQLRQLDPEIMVERLQEACNECLQMTPEAKFAALIEPLADRSLLGSRIDALAVCEVLDKVVQLVGKPDKEMEDRRPSLLLEALQHNAKILSQECDLKLAEMAIHFLEQPQFRVAGAEEAIRQMTARLQQVAAGYETLSLQLEREAGEIYNKLFPMIGGLNGFSLMSNRRAGAVAEVIELLKQYPVKRYQSLVAQHLLSVYRGMVGSCPEYLREVNFCRQRLAESVTALDKLADAEPALDPALGPGQYVFNGGVTSLDAAAAQIIAALTSEDLLDVDTALQTQIRKHYKGLVNYCLETNLPAIPMHEIMLTEVGEWLASRIDELDPADVFMLDRSEQDMRRDITRAFAEAMPELAGPRSPREALVALIAVPDSESGRALRELARATLPEVELLPATVSGEVVFYRELRSLNLIDLPQLSPQAKEAYQQLCKSDTPPHSRHDTPWIPVGK